LIAIGIGLSMNRVPNLSPFRAQEAPPTSPDIPPLPDILPLPGEMSKQNWQKLVRPKLVEKAALIADVIFIVAASLLCWWSYSWITNGNIANWRPFAGLGTIVAVNFTAIMAARRNYRLKNLAQVTMQARDTIIVWSGVYGMLALAGFAMKISSDFSRGSTMLFFAGGLATLLSFRLLVANLITQSLANGSFARKKIIVVAEQHQHGSSRSLTELRRYGYQPVKTCEVSREEVAATGIPTSLRSKLANVIQFSKDEQIEDIYILMDWRHHRTIYGILHALAVLPVSVHLIPDENAAQFLNYPITNIGDTWTAALRRAPLSHAERAAKRFFDLSLAATGLLMLLPLMLTTALLIKLDSRGPVFFRQKRNGFNGEAFNIIKFRSMHVLENGPHILQATRNDPRVTRLGRWLRRSSIDELPQLLNVIRGDMSLVGPRPHASSHNTEYEKLIANYAFRHHVKPGLTGWAQVNGYRGETRQIKQMERRVEHDLWYINNWSPLLDVKILLRTIAVTLRQTTAY
jgi:Undecaprenyl-phosphate glucose phosphotransferase